MERLVGNKTKIKKRAIGHTKPFLGEVRMFLIRRGPSRCATCISSGNIDACVAGPCISSPKSLGTPGLPRGRQPSLTSQATVLTCSSTWPFTWLFSVYVRTKLNRLEYCYKLLYILRQIDSGVGLSRKFPEANFQNFAKVQFCWIFWWNLTVLGKISSLLSKSKSP